MDSCQDQHNLDVEVVAQVVGLQDVAHIMFHPQIPVLVIVVTLDVEVTGVEDHHHHTPTNHAVHVVQAALEVQLS